MKVLGRAPDDATRRRIARLLGHPEMRLALWDWQYGDARSLERALPVVLLDEGNEVAGFNGIMPVRVRVDGRERRAAWSCDYHVAEPLRGRGVGRRVKEALHAREPLLLTLGLSDAAAGVLPRLGWRPSADVASFRLAREASGTRGLLRRALSRGARLHPSALRVPGRAFEHLSLRVEEVLPAAALLDRLWRRVGASWSRIVVRDARYLHWRYGAYPFGGYVFLRVADGAGLRALAVLRHAGKQARLVDLVVARDDALARAAVLDGWFGWAREASFLQVTTSDRLLAALLRGHGFLRGDRPVGFMVRTDEAIPAPERGWFVMGGDSDGEFLQSGREAMGRPASALPGSPPVERRRGAALELRVLEPERLFRDPSRWNALLDRSDADPLFLGCAWQSAWWDTWGDALGLRPLFIGAFEGRELVGLAPFYQARTRRYGRRWTTLQLNGNAWRIAPTVRTEYADLLAARSRRSEVASAVVRFLGLRVGWDNLVLCDQARDAVLPGLEGWRGVRRRVERRDEGVVVDTSGDHAAWLASLSRSTRLKVHNRRRYLEAHGDLACTAAPDVEQVLEELNAFHVPRWGRPCFSGPSLDFHRRFRERLGERGEFRCTRLRVNDRLCGVLYDVRVRDRIYNLQAGYLEQFDPKVSLGSLHLGFAIERAFDDPLVRHYDLLAGAGKQVFYKRSFRGEAVRFTTTEFVRTPELAAAHAVRQLLRSGSGAR